MNSDFDPPLSETHKPRHHRSCQHVGGQDGVELLEDTGSDMLCHPDCPVANAQPYDPWYDNQVQFPRLLDEISAVLDTQLPAYRQLVLNVTMGMDCCEEDVWALFRRAERSWDRIKADMAAGRHHPPEFVISDDLNALAERMWGAYSDPESNGIDQDDASQLAQQVNAAYRKERGLDAP